VETAAVIAAVGLVVVSLFQLALAAGAPWGEAAYGGGNPGVLPKVLRINSLVFGLVLFPAVVVYVLDIGGVIDAEWLPGSRTFVIWVLVVFFAIGTLMNGISRSRIERVLWTPMNVVLLGCCLVLAFG
jgi:amino acid permease